MSRPGRLSVRWTKKRDDAGPGTIGAKLGYQDQGDLLFSRGDGVPRCDGSFAYSVFDYVKAPYSSLTLAEELHARGYDLRTLKFSIDKRRP